VVSRKALGAYAKLHPDSAPSLSNWLLIVRKAKWGNFEELRADFGSADQVGRRTVFNTAGNKYGLIARVNYRIQAVFVLHILKHTEYEKGGWK
jgi:mRNA interferase HigB